MTRKWLLLVLALGLGLLPGQAAAAPARVVIRDGLVSASFDATPVPEAVEAVRRASGLELVLPIATRARTLTLAAEGIPVDRFLVRLLAALDLGGFALVYEANGTASRVIVVDRASGASTSSQETPPGSDPVPPQAVPAGEAEAAPAATPVVLSAEDLEEQRRRFEAVLTTIPPQRLGLPAPLPPEQMLPFPATPAP